MGSGLSSKDKKINSVRWRLLVLVQICLQQKLVCILLQPLFADANSCVLVKDTTLSTLAHVLAPMETWEQRGLQSNVTAMTTGIPAVS